MRGFCASDVVARAFDTASTLEGGCSLGGVTEDSFKGSSRVCFFSGWLGEARRAARDGGVFARRREPQGPGGILRVARFRTCCRDNASDQRALANMLDFESQCCDEGTGGLV